MDHFVLHSEYQPTGDQPQAIEELVKGFQEGNQCETLLGVTGSGKTFTMANVIQKLNKPTLIIAHNKTLAAQLYGEFKEFFPENAVEYFVSYYDYYQPEAYVPSSDTYIAKDSARNDEIDKLRLSATSALSERNDVIVVSSVSCIYGIGSPKDYMEMIISLRPGMEKDRDDVIRQLIDIQYDRNDMDFHRGTFRVRGDVLEIFPAEETDKAVRVEFFGDEIDRLVQIDTLTGEILCELNHIAIFPASHYVVPMDTILKATGEIEKDMEEQVKFFKHEGKLIEAQRIEERTNFDIEMLKETGICSGIENYSRYLSGLKPGEPPYTLMDYFGDDFLIIVDESHITIPQIGGMYAGDQSRKSTLVDYGFRLPSAKDNRPLNFEEFESKINQMLFVSATPGQYEKDHELLRAEQIIRPTGLLDPYVEVRPVEGQIDDLVGEVNKEVEKHNKILVTTLTKRMAEELTDYMMAKHGLERNRVMAERDAQKDFAEYQKQYPKSTKTLQDFIDECRKRDYAGLTALTGMEEIVDAEAEAQVMVDEYENAHDTTALWSKVNAVSKAVLSKSYECGMMSKETYDSVRDMYEFYIPLRGFDEKTSSEAYAYLTHKQSLFNAPIKKAEGRRSKADDPFANLQSMAESAIMQGNRNKLVKQKFLNFALNHPSDLVSVSDLWLQYDAVADEWKPIFPDNIDINDSPEEVERKMNEFEDKMKQLAESAPDNYKHGKDAVNIPYRVVENRNLRQHQVVVKRNGRDYVITINGNPRAAQALNGQTNPDNDISGSIGQLVHLIGDVNRTLSSLYTTLQPDFIASNFLRDMVYSNSMVWVKESPKYAIQYNMNFAKLPIVRMVMLLDKYRRGTLDMNDEIEKMFYQFMMNGGETGFSRMADIDEHKKEIKKMLKAANEKIPAHVVRECMATWIGEVGRGIEMRARFAAFVTSRNAGRTIDRSIWDAKEISVNFNKKGAGDKFLGAEGQTMLGNVAAGVSGAGRAGYIFWNAALQGTFGNFLKYAMRHPGKMGTVVASWYGLAMLVTALASAGGDDDDDSYYDIPEHTRRQNLIVKGPGNAWIKIPLPIEYRAVYAMGELTGSSLFHNEKLEVSDVLAQMSQLLPVDMMEGTKALWPSSVKPMVEVSNNESWYGSPIWKDTPYNKYMPNWTKAYKSANKDLVNLSETLNEVSGGSKYRKGTIDLNPAAIEYLLKQYTGGFFTVTNQIRNLINVGTGEKDFDWRYVPLANRMLMSGGDERNVGRGLDEKFFGYLDAYRAKASEFSAIKGDLSLPLEKKAELISEIIIDPEYVKMKEMERIYSKLKKAYDTAKEIGDTSKAEELEKRINELKRTFILEMEQDERK